jgi:starch-binding outer membrane protein, SusD/RagB family
MKWKWLNNSKCIFIASILIILNITGCKKLVHVEEPDDSLSAGAVFSNDSLAQAAITGLYIKIMTSTKFLLNGGMSLLPGLSADELERTSPSIIEDQFNYNGILSNNQLVNVNLWKAAYFYIYQCNICMEGLQRSAGVSAEVKKRLSGEVQFVRALTYYYLVNLYGDVPLVLSTNADVNALLPRAQANKVYKQMETDLLAAFDALPENQSNTTPTRYAAQALLARIYLHLQNWNKAEELASAVINSGQFILQTDLNAVFKRLSKEIIFQWAPVVDKTNAPEGLMFVPANAALRPAYILTKGLLSAFEAGDLRKTNWIKNVKIGTQNYDYPYKYKVYVSSGAPTEYNVVLRLAEQYLIRAEALARQNRVTEAVADINTIRMRAQLPGISTSISSEECFQAIEKERRTELFAEWGHRWFDLKRTNRANDVLPATKGSNWHSNDQLYPIPFSELEAAPNLQQNPGYE